MFGVYGLLFLACTDPQKADADADGVTLADGDCNDFDANSTTTQNDAD